MTAWTGWGLLAGMKPLIIAAALAAFALPAAAQDHPLDGVWKGAYDCAQGRTGLTLTLDASPNGQVTGTFAFWPRSDNPYVARGSFRVVGTVAPKGELQLRGVSWIDQPANYSMVDLAGAVYRGDNGAIDSMLGDVLGAPGCTKWAAKRQ